MTPFPNWSGFVFLIVKVLILQVSWQLQTHLGLVALSLPG